jgi:hypothetical protein
MSNDSMTSTLGLRQGPTTAPRVEIRIIIRHGMSTDTRHAVGTAAGVDDIPGAIERLAKRAGGAA